MIEDVLKNDLSELARRFAARDMKLILGGGFGLLLKQRFVRRNRLRTLFNGLPNTRATGDLDLFLQIELITDEENTKWLRKQIDDLGYQPEVKFLKFSKSISNEAGSPTVEIDLLTPDPGDHPDARVSDVRVRPKAYSYSDAKLHGYKTPEAFAVDRKTTCIQIEEEEETDVYLPNPFSYLMLKLMAFRDRKEKTQHADTEENRARYQEQANAHAYDIYMILGLTTETEWKEAEQLSNEYNQHEIPQEVIKIKDDLFSSMTDPGIISIREHGKNTGNVIRADHLQQIPKYLDELF